MNRYFKHPITTILLFLVGLSLLLTAGCLQKQHNFLTRGLPDGLPAVSANNSTAFGINVDLFQYDDDELAQQLDAISALGMTHIKQSFYFVEPFDWQESDRILTAVSQTNLHLIPVLDGDPATQFAKPDDISAFAEWAGDFAFRYQTNLDSYIVWDEPNLSSHWGGTAVNPTEYAALLSAAADAIRLNDLYSQIVLAPLAPTSETGPANLSETLFLKALYESGAKDSFDIVAVKPYGFDTDATDRRVAEDVLNFSRPILIRERMIAHGDDHKKVWAGNWGWNSLPEDWNGRSSVWGATSESQQANQTISAWQRAQAEWPWMGLMFLENWAPNAPADDPVWGFSIAGRSTSQAIKEAIAAQPTNAAMPGFHLARPDSVGQSYEGGWEFSPDFGADISETADGEPADKVTVTFWGTDFGVRVRRADYRARLYITIDGQPANALPKDENGSNLILTAPSADIDELVIEPVAKNLPLGIHTAEITASRGWDQWAISGFSVGNSPPPNRAIPILKGLGVFFLLAAVLAARQVAWQAVGNPIGGWVRKLSHNQQLLFAGLTAVIVALSGWLTWGEQASGIYRRLGDPAQLALTAVTATLFYVTPSLYIYVIALLVLFVLIYFRPVWGLALVAVCFPLYVPPLAKPILNYRFSPTEIFTLITVTAVLLRTYTTTLASHAPRLIRKPNLLAVDWAVVLFTAVATLSLLFTERLDVATNEWRVVIVEPVLFYIALRLAKPTKQELWLIFEAFLLSGFIVASYGLWQFFFIRDALITAEGGLMRIRAFYGSPNNVGLYLGRLLPILTAVWLIGWPSLTKWRRAVYGVLLALTAVVLLLTFSRGAILLGVPAAFAFIFWQWQKENGRKTWPWLLSGLLLAAGALFILSQLPQFAGRFDLRGQTSFFRLALWQASWQMFLDHPWFGVGLDNFLYAYRGQYILNSAWQEPDLNHPHNIFLDFATRLGLFGLISGGLLFYLLARYLKKGMQSLTGKWQALAMGMIGALIEIVVHGLVDHSFFLVDLAFVFMWLLGTAVIMQINESDALGK